MPLPKAAQRLASDPRVRSIYKDPPDGWWIELHKGFAFEPEDPPYGGQHITSELTLKELRRWLDQIHPCACVDCQQQRR